MSQQKPLTPMVDHLTGTEEIRVVQNGKAWRAMVSMIVALVPAPLKGDKGDKGDPGIQGNPGIKGDPGLKGDKGDPAQTYLGTVVVTEKVLVAVSVAGLRTVANINAPGVLATDKVSIYPVSLPAGYAVHNAVVTGKDTISVTISTPVLAALTTYTITCAIYAVGR